MKPRTLVIGAGPAGLACAVQLARAGGSVTVVEASPHVGGMARTLPLWGQRVDLGPHRFFSNIPRVNRFWREFAGAECSRVSRLTRIHFNGRFFRYPLDPLDVLKNLGPVSGLRTISSYAARQLRPKSPPKSLEDFIVQRFGSHLFESFFKAYSEKLWGVPCNRIDPSWGSQRIGKLSALEALKAAFLPSNGRKHKTLVDEFLYPKGGSGVVYERMAAEIELLSGKVHRSSSVESILVDSGNKVRGVRLSSGTELVADHVVSTLPLTHLVRALPGAPQVILESARKLRFRNTLLVYLEIDSPSVFPDNWIYVNSSNVQHGRITNFRNWCPSLHGDRPTTILCMEFWAFDGEPLWTTDEESLARQAQGELRQLGFLPPQVEVLRYHVCRVPKSYPVYEIGFRDRLRPIQEYIGDQRGLLAIGRGGSFKYNNQDHSILMGLAAAEEILTGVPQGLWDLNSDSNYQESGTISDEREENQSIRLKSA